jgi:hypothetical protein
LTYRKVPAFKPKGKVLCQQSQSAKSSETFQKVIPSFKSKTFKTSVMPSYQTPLNHYVPQTTSSLIPFDDNGICPFLDICSMFRLADGCTMKSLCSRTHVTPAINCLCPGTPSTAAMKNPYPVTTSTPAMKNICPGTPCTPAMKRPYPVSF